VATEKGNKANEAAQEKATSERQKALDTALAQIERQFGKGSVMKMSDRQNQIVEVIPTGSIALDIALGIGGLPRGRIVEIYGPESSGKTTLTLHAIANAQAAGGICAFIDAEHAFDAEYASWALILMLFLFHNQTQVNKHSKLWTCLFAQVHLIS
jgi:recombination protein RecA